MPWSGEKPSPDLGDLMSGFHRLAGKILTWDYASGQLVHWRMHLQLKPSMYLSRTCSRLFAVLSVMDVAIACLQQDIRLIWHLAYLLHTSALS